MKDDVRVKTWPVMLTWSEVLQGALNGVHRQVSSLRDGRKPGHGISQDKCWQAHIEGACGEIAVAKVCGVYWAAPLNTFKGGSDVGAGVCRLQVRTRSEDHYDLIVRDDDSPQKVFVLVTGRAPVYVVHGWMRASEVREHPEWRKAHGGRLESWFVPQEALHSMLELPPDVFDEDASE